MLTPLVLTTLRKILVENSQPVLKVVSEYPYGLTKNQMDLAVRLFNDRAGNAVAYVAAVGEIPENELNYDNLYSVIADYGEDSNNGKTRTDYKPLTLVDIHDTPVSTYSGRGLTLVVHGVKGYVMDARGRMGEYYVMRGDKMTLATEAQIDTWLASLTAEQEKAILTHVYFQPLRDAIMLA